MDRLWRAAAVIVAVASAWLAAVTPVSAPAGGAASPREVVRLQVVAHSDAPADQAHKRAVGEALLAGLHDLSELAAGGSTPAVLETLAQRRERLQALAQRVLDRRGAAYRARALVGRHVFGARSHRGLLLPAGRYPSLRVVLGAGRGHNWWCIVFPPLCAAPPVARRDAVPAGAADWPLPSPGALAASGYEPTDPAPLEVRLAVLEWLRRHPRWERLTHAPSRR